VNVKMVFIIYEHTNESANGKHLKYTLFDMIDRLLIECDEHEEKCRKHEEKINVSDNELKELFNKYMIMIEKRSGSSGE